MKRLSALMMIAGAFVAVAADGASACRFKHRACCMPPAPISLHSDSPNPTADTARQALIEMLTGKDAPNFDTRQREVDALKNGKNLLVMANHAEGIVPNYWNCELLRMRFSFIAPIGSCLYECHGDFELIQGKWTAKVTGSSWAHLGPKGPP